MFALWPGDWLNFSNFKLQRFGFAGQRAASEAGHIANTNVVCKPRARLQTKDEIRKNSSNHEGELSTVFAK
jgi:hypothetical protein